MHKYILLLLMLFFGFTNSQTFLYPESVQHWHLAPDARDSLLATGIANDTTALKSLTFTLDGSRAFLEGLASGSSIGAGEFAQIDSAYPEGVIAYDNATTSKQWVRVDYLRDRMVYANWGSTFHKALAASEALGVNLAVSDSQAVTQSDTTDVNMIFLGKGKLHITNNSYNFHFRYKRLMAGELQQVFHDTTGTITGLQEVYAGWWGIFPVVGTLFQGATWTVGVDASARINKIINTTFPPVFRLSGGEYFTTSPIYLRSGVTLVGQESQGFGGSNTRIVFNGSAGAVAAIMPDPTLYGSAGAMSRMQVRSLRMTDARPDLGSADHGWGIYTGNTVNGTLIQHVQVDQFPFGSICAGDTNSSRNGDMIEIRDCWLAGGSIRTAAIETWGVANWVTIRNIATPAPIAIANRSGNQAQTVYDFKGIKSEVHGDSLMLKGFGGAFRLLTTSVTSRSGNAGRVILMSSRHTALNISKVSQADKIFSAFEDSKGDTTPVDITNYIPNYATSAKNYMDNLEITSGSDTVRLERRHGNVATGNARHITDAGFDPANLGGLTAMPGLPDTTSNIIVRGLSGQTSRVFTIVNESGNHRFSIDKDGIVYIGSSQIQILSGSGSPEGVVTAPVGSHYYRTDGGTNTSFYVKESGTGNTGWAAK